MRIGIDFDNTLTDTNYALIDLINLHKPKDEQITYEDFNKSKVSNVWQHSSITAKDFMYKKKCEERLFKEMDLAILAKSSINDLIKCGDEIVILTERPLIEYLKVYNFLRNKGLNVEGLQLIAGVDKQNIQQIIQDLSLDIYIEDNPSAIMKCKDPLPLIVVRGHDYNKECYNLMRLECFSQLKLIRKRAIGRIKHIKDTSYELSANDIYWESRDTFYGESTESSIEALSEVLDNQSSFK